MSSIKGKVVDSDSKCRGYFVADYSTLRFLSSECSSVDSGSYLYLLTKLADMGFKIIVPETVKYETDYFDPLKLDLKANKFSGVTSADISSMRAQQRFFAKDHPNVIHVPAGDGAAYSDYCRSMRTLEEQHASNMQNATKTKFEWQKISGVSARIKAVQKEYAGKQLGEEHCFDVIKSLLADKDRDVPIIFLSDDTKAHKAFKSAEWRDKSRVKICATYDLIRFLDQPFGNPPEVLLKKIGIHKSVPEIVQDLSQLDRGLAYSFDLADTANTMTDAERQRWQNIADSAKEGLTQFLRSGIEEALAEEARGATAIETRTDDEHSASASNPRLAKLQGWQQKAAAHQAKKNQKATRTD